MKPQTAVLLITMQTTQRLGSGLSYEQYCAELGLDVGDVRRATVTRALWALCGGSTPSEATERDRLASIDAEPGETTEHE